MFVVFYTVNLYSCIHMTCSTSNCVYGTLTDPWNICIYRVWKNSVPKFCEVIGWTKTKIYCQATVCRTCILAVPWTMKVSLTKVRNQAKPLQYPRGGGSVVCYQLRTDVQTYRHPPWYTSDAKSNADADTAEIDVCAQKCQVGAWWLLLPQQFSSESTGYV